MKPIPFTSRALAALTTLCLFAGAAARAETQNLELPAGVTFGAAAWMQYGIIGKSSVDINSAAYHEGAFNGKSILTPGAQLSLGADISERLHIATGIGVVAGTSLAMGPLGINGGYALPGVYAYVPEAYFKYGFWNEAGSKLSVTGGLFSYDYNPEVKNLGLYLLRGPVYPGILVSGFETKHTLPVANMVGLQVHHQTGKFQQDFLLSSEMEYYPFFDLSPAYVANYQVHPSLRVGAGINFYHLIPADGKLTKGLKSGKDYWIYRDTTGAGAGGQDDTTKIGYNGTKVMANAAFDPKPLFGGAEWLGSEDLKLYGEIALIGLDGGSAYKKVYGGYAKRMPVMVGFNIPTMKALDHLSLEVEWYGSDVEDNLDNYTVQGSSHPVSPFPTNWDVNGQVYTHRVSRDNWKWSLHGARMVDTHIQLSFQVANDHYRPGIYHGYGDSNPPYQNAVLVSPKDWYLTTKLAWFF